MANKDLARFFPEQRTICDLPDREYFFNVINTVEPNYLKTLIQHAQQLRFANKDPQENPKISLRLMIFGKRNFSNRPIFLVSISFNIFVGSPGKTLMLLKKASKP
jgi:hypothetical protein